MNPINTGVLKTNNPYKGSHMYKEESPKLQNARPHKTTEVVEQPSQHYGKCEGHDNHTAKMEQNELMNCTIL